MTTTLIHREGCFEFVENSDETVALRALTFENGGFRDLAIALSAYTTMERKGECDDDANEETILGFPRPSFRAGPFTVYRAVRTWTTFDYLVVFDLDGDEPEHILVRAKDFLDFHRTYIGPALRQQTEEEKAAALSTIADGVTGPWPHIIADAIRRASGTCSDPVVPIDYEQVEDAMKTGLKKGLKDLASETDEEAEA